MSAALLEQARAAGVTLWSDGGSLRYRGDSAAVASLLPTIEARKTEILAALQNNAKAERLDALLAKACQGVPGIDAAAFRTLLSPEDVQDIEGGHIPLATLNAYAQSFAEGIHVGRIRE